MHKAKLLVSSLLILSLLLTACGNDKKNNGKAPSYSSDSGEAVLSIDTAFETTVKDIFSNKDVNSEFSETSATKIKFSTDKVVAENNSVNVSGTTATIKAEGTYIVYGNCSNGNIIINAPSDAKITLVFDSLKLNSDDFAPLYVKSSDKVFILLADGKENRLTNGGSFKAIDENAVDSVIFSKQDLTIKGSGSLTVTTEAGSGITSKDDLKITGGKITVEASVHGLDANDMLAIKDADITITSGKDGVHCENSDNADLGSVYVTNSLISVTSTGDGFSAGAYILIDSGSIDVTSGGGHENGKEHSDSNMMGGPGGGRPRTTDKTDTSVSAKAIKSVKTLHITNGTFKIDSADDSIHSNSAVLITGGTFTIKCGDDAIHADTDVAIRGGKISITESYEGLEAINVEVSGGDTNIKSSDDGINASGGNDDSGFGGGRPGQDGFSSSSKGSVTVTGGTLYINAGGDGVDSNGSLKVTGGMFTVCGPTRGDTSVLDFDTSAEITGGVFIGSGSTMMAQTFTSSTQGVISLNVGNATAKTKVALTDKDGNEIISFSPEQDFNVVIISTPKMVSGEDYTVTVGDQSGTFKAN